SQYYTTLQQVDDYLKGLFNLVETDATLMGKTAIVLTSDHGGGISQPTSHGCSTCPEHYTIPFFAWGPGIQAGADLYALNTGVRSDPGTGRPDYNASPQPLRNAGIGNLALQLLGLPAIPGSQSNTSQDIVLGTCVVDADCDDLNACTDDICDQGECSNPNNTDSCDDGDACTDGDVCDSGSCNAGGPLACDDANGCTDNGCNPASGCEYTNNTVPCDNGDACTSDDTCGGGSCQAGGATDCDDLDECTADSCDQIAGCAHDPIPLCGGGASVPSASPGGRMLVGLMLMSAGAVLLVQRRRIGS
ncbi:MAG: sulfatase-like hydrolase/transferase, partial [Deltaproteobacteria bacterium]|nr:sulfatase-like hydrolase/transferase [Deltaproteobacteria bacterium]